jgi:hypothetical protein
MTKQSPLTLAYLIIEYSGLIVELDENTITG